MKKDPRISARRLNLILIKKEEKQLSSHEFYHSSETVKIRESEKLTNPSILSVSWKSCRIWKWQWSYLPTPTLGQDMAQGQFF